MLAASVLWVVWASSGVVFAQQLAREEYIPLYTLEYIS